MRLIGAASRSFLLHRLLTGLIRHPLVRLMTEVLLIPAVMDSRLVTWLRGLLRQTRLRMEELQRQKDDVDQLLLLDEEGQLVDGLPRPLPSNRAERRAAQRHVGNRPQ